MIVEASGTRNKPTFWNETIKAGLDGLAFIVRSIGAMEIAILEFQRV